MLDSLLPDRRASDIVSSRAAPESLYALKFPSDPQLSPDGTRVAFVLTRVEDEDEGHPDSDEGHAPRYRSRIQVSDGGAARDLTGGEGRDTSPRWAPDGTALAFLSDRSTAPEIKGKAQVFLLPLGGGEARQLTRFKNGVSNLAFSPDGRYLSFLSRGDAEDRRDERGEAARHHLAALPLQRRRHAAAHPRRAVPARPDERRDAAVARARPRPDRPCVAAPTRAACCS